MVTKKVDKLTAAVDKLIDDKISDLDPMIECMPLNIEEEKKHAVDDMDASLSQPTPLDSPRTPVKLQLHKLLADDDWTPEKLIHAPPEKIRLPPGLPLQKTNLANLFDMAAGDDEHYDGFFQFTGEDCDAQEDCMVESSQDDDENDDASQAATSSVKDCLEETPVGTGTSRSGLAPGGKPNKQLKQKLLHAIGAAVEQLNFRYTDRTSRAAIIFDHGFLERRFKPICEQALKSRIRRRHFRLQSGTLGKLDGAGGRPEVLDELLSNVLALTLDEPATNFKNLVLDKEEMFARENAQKLSPFSGEALESRLNQSTNYMHERTNYEAMPDDMADTDSDSWDEFDGEN